MRKVRHAGGQELAFPTLRDGGPIAGEKQRGEHFGQARAGVFGDFFATHAGRDGVFGARGFR